MAKKKENFRALSSLELQKRLAEFREKERSIRFKAEGARSKNVKELKNLKKQIARMLTVVNTNEKK